MKNTNLIKVGNMGIGRFGLFVKKENGKHYWGIEDCDGIVWEEVSEQLFRALAGHEFERATRAAICHAERLKALKPEKAKAYDYQLAATLRDIDERAKAVAGA